MEISNIWGTAKAQIGEAIDKNTEDIEKNSTDVKDLSGKLSNSDSFYKVGDTLTTLRTDLGDNWLKCNGAAIDTGKYSEFAKMPSLSYGYIQGLSGNAVDGLTHYNNKFVTIFRSTTSGSSGYPAVGISSDMGVTWTEHVISSSACSTLVDIACYNGTWVVLGKASSTSVDVWVSTNLTGTWTKITLVSDSYSTPVALACYNGTWVALVSYNSQYAYGYVATNAYATWTKTTIIPSTNRLTVKAIGCYNGTWAVVGYDLNDNGIRSNLVYTSTNPTGTWTVNSNAYLSETLVGFVDVACHNGTWVAVGTYYKNSSALRTGYIYTTTNPAGTWIKNNNITFYETANDKTLTYADGTWMVGGRINYDSALYGYIYESSNPAGTWTIRYVEPESGTRIYGIARSGSDFVAVVNTGTNLISSKYRKLPNISSDTATTYIKVADA